jgi:DNA-binding NtrC family response regulator
MDQPGFPRDAAIPSDSDFASNGASGWGLVAVSAPMREVVKLVEQAGATRAGVSVVGESGSGRALVARAIHRSGVTAAEAFVPILCDQVGPGEAEGLLFGPKAGGHRRSAQGTICETVTPGSLLHQAIGGTLYFRHPEELPDRVQSRLARVLRDGEVLVGSSLEAQPLQIRPIAAFGPDPERHVADGHVRLDFFRRVSAHRIDVPPLRNRKEDIPLLAAHFLARACKTAGLPAKRLTMAAATLLSALPWPGNNQDLHALLASLVRSTTEQEVDLDALLAHVRLDGASHHHGTPGGVSGTLREARLEFEREYIMAVLAQNHGRIPDTARILGIQRTNLYRKLRTLRVSKATLAT